MVHKHSPHAVGMDAREREELDADDAVTAADIAAGIAAGAAGAGEAEAEEGAGEGEGEGAGGGGWHALLYRSRAAFEASAEVRNDRRATLSTLY